MKMNHPQIRAETHMSKSFHNYLQQANCITMSGNLAVVSTYLLVLISNLYCYISTRV